MSSQQSPLDPKANSATPNATRAKRNAKPAKRNARPAKSKASPVKPKASPVKSKASPVKSKASPVKSKASPVKSKASPVKSKAVRAKSAADPVSPDASRLRPQTPAVGALTAGRRGGENGRVSIVGIGASAGGLEALERLFRHMPSGSGLAFIVVQHLDPTHKGMLAQLLQRVTPMKVVQIRDRLRVEPNRVYVIPPNRDLSISRGVLRLVAPAAPRGLRLPIDFFFESLAADQQRRSIGVILSGMGSDGTLGLRAIKAQGGSAFVQEPATAKFDAMPRSAIDAGYADVVAPVEILAGSLAAHGENGEHAGAQSFALAPTTHSAIGKICALLRSQTGHDFTQYKRSAVYRRIERRMSLHQIDSIAAYARHLQGNPQETLLLFKELLIGVTNFFRDTEGWAYLKQHALPALLTERASGGVLRAWVAGCSTGEEAYSLAIVFKEALARVRGAPSLSLQVFATDLDKDAIDRARQGVYPATIAANVSAERLRQYFVNEGQGYRVSQEIREMVIFATQNVIMDPPFTKLDILCCRNLLIYLGPELQKKLFPLFAYSLNPGGFLFLGNAETPGTSAELFDTAGSKARVYRRLDSPQRTAQVEFPLPLRGPAPMIENSAEGKVLIPSLGSLTDRILLERYSPAAVLTNDQGDILYISGRTGKYLEPAAGKANWNIHAMAREGLRCDLGSAFRKAIRTKKRAVQLGVSLGDERARRTVDVTIEPLQVPDALRGMVLIVFADAAAPPALRPEGSSSRPLSAAAKLERELRHAREEVRAVREVMQTSQEELKAANEELQSTNEELQSTNEELTTSKEEMQSMNEELQTLNHELQVNVDELSRANNDMRNLLDSTEIATLFLDGALRVRRYTPQMTKIIKLIPSDVGRPFTDLASDLVYPELAADALTVLKTLVFKETPIKTVDGRWFLVRIMPYRTQDNRIDGLVATFADITAAKALEASLRAKQA